MPCEGYVCDDCGSVLDLLQMLPLVPDDEL
jgi:predicted nucleic acid-binding Zn ribbon protein